MIPDEDVIAELSVKVRLPVKFVLHSSEAFPFKISIFYGTKPGALPVATWIPRRGLARVSHTYSLLLDAGVVPQLDAFCKRAYAAWKEDNAGT